jgi:tRNA threonylcarbamoyladenosine biosynthesis protein TsaB
MNLLALDTSSENVSLSIMQKGKIVIDFNKRINFGASKLIGYINKNIKKASLGLADFDAFIIGAGPGSFTGLRISFSIIKAFVMVTQKPAFAIGSFFSCASPLRDKARRITVISDARRNSVYCASFEYRNGVLNRCSREKLIKIDKLAVEGENRESLFVTYDSCLRKQFLDYNSDVNFYPYNVYPSARHLISCVEKDLDRKKFTALRELEPIYLHPKTCQIR